MADERAFWGVSAENVILAGFSQGAIMALHAAATEPGAAGLVVSFSGRLASPVVRAPGHPILLVHGQADPVIAVHETAVAAAAFLSAGREVKCHVLAGVGHTITPAAAAWAVASLTPFGRAA